MSEDKDAKYPGQGGIGEAYAKLNEDNRKDKMDAATVTSIGNVRRLIDKISAKDRAISSLTREREMLERERDGYIEQIKILLAPYTY